MPNTTKTQEVNVTKADCAAFRRERPHLEHWSDDQIRKYYEGVGGIRPPPPQSCKKTA